MSECEMNEYSHHKLLHVHVCQKLVLCVVLTGPFSVKILLPVFIYDAIFFSSMIGKREKLKKQEKRSRKSRNKVKKLCKGWGPKETQRYEIVKRSEHRSVSNPACESYKRLHSYIFLEVICQIFKIALLHIQSGIQYC